MEDEEFFKRMMNNEVTMDEFFEYAEEKMVKEHGYTKEEAKYASRLIRDPKFCKKETGYTSHELFLIKDRLTPEQARYVVENPCIDGPREKCDYFQREDQCHGCTNMNGFFYWKLGPEKNVKPVKKTWDILKGKTLAIVNLGKEERKNGEKHEKV